MSDLLQRIQEIRLDKMRLGNNTGTPVSPLSMPEIKFVLVPLTEGESDMALESASSLTTGENVAGALRREKWRQYWTLVYAIRDPADLTKRVFPNPAIMLDNIEEVDANFLWEEYVLMVDKSSPSLEGVTGEALEELKKGLAEISWGDLRGKQWAVLKAFLMSLSQAQLRDSFPGFGSTYWSMRTNESSESTPNAETSS